GGRGGRIPRRGGACRNPSTACPAFRGQPAAVSPPMPAPAMRTFSVIEWVTAGVVESSRIYARLRCDSTQIRAMPPATANIALQNYILAVEDDGAFSDGGSDDRHATLEMCRPWSARERVVRGRSHRPVPAGH